jgi:hypothetical protein
MLNNILNLDGAQVLTVSEQKSISGGLICQGEICIISEGLATCYRSKCNGKVYDPSCCSQIL